MGNFEQANGFLKKLFDEITSEDYKKLQHSRCKQREKDHLHDRLNKDHSYCIKSERSIDFNSRPVSSRNIHKNSLDSKEEKNGQASELNRLLNVSDYNKKKQPSMTSNQNRKTTQPRDESLLSKRIANTTEDDAQSEVSIDLDTYNKPMKLNRPFLKLAYFVAKTWKDQLHNIDKFAEYCNVRSTIFNPYNVIYFQNKLLRQFEDRLDDELLQFIFPKFRYGVGIKKMQGFGEVSLFEVCNRNANLYTYKIFTKQFLSSKYSIVCFYDFEIFFFLI